MYKISKRLYLDACTLSDGVYVKDFCCSGDLRMVIIVDNNPQAYSWQPDNTFGCTIFFTDSNDRELKQLGDFMALIKDMEDVRGKLSQWKHWGELASNTDAVGTVRPLSNQSHLLHQSQWCQDQKILASTLSDGAVPPKKRRMIASSLKYQSQPQRFIQRHFSDNSYVHTSHCNMRGYKEDQVCIDYGPYIE